MPLQNTDVNMWTDMRQDCWTIWSLAKHDWEQLNVAKCVLLVHVQERQPDAEGDADRK